jgi:two-component system, OmpR family, response regulator ResD
MITILVVDDEQHIRTLLADYLRNEHFHVIEASDGLNALTQFENHAIDLVLLDVMMPGMTGYEVSKTIRKQSAVPIIFLTALGQSNHEIEGFNAGADDYIAKPFEFHILKARIQAILKRSNKLEVYQVNQIVINEQQHLIKIKDVSVNLTKKEYDLLLYMVKHKNIALSREQILSTVWGYDFFGDERTVDTHIKQLRSKLGDEGNSIKTIRGYGYKLEVH